MDVSAQAGSASLCLAVCVSATRRIETDELPFAATDDEGPASKNTRIYMIAGVEYEHEDAHNYASFMHAELDSLEEFAFGLASGDVGEKISSEDALLQQLIFPYTKHEPQLFAEQMLQLDAVAMQVEAMPQTFLHSLCHHLAWQRAGWKTLLFQAS